MRRVRKLFDNSSNDIILNFMKERGYHSNSYAEISSLIPKYSARQIRQHWTNQLDPRLNHDPFEEDEATFIIQWIEKNQTPNGSICWKELIHEIECRFNKLRSKNKIKNFWYSRKRRLLLPKSKENPSTSTVDTVCDLTFTVIYSSLIPPPTTLQPNPDPPQFNAPDRMKPVF